MKKAKSKPVIKVVAAVIEKDGKVLIARRCEENDSGGLWEFPGGQIKGGETPEKGLEREIAEELGIHVHVGKLLKSVTHRRPNLAIELLAYHASIVSGDINLTDHDEIRWAEPSALEESTFSVPDRSIVRLLKLR